MRQIVLYPDEDGVWCAQCPSLPGCYSDGKTKEEAITNIREAIQLYIEELVEHHEPIPQENFQTLIALL